MAESCLGTQLEPDTACRVVVRFSGARLGTTHGVLTLTGEGTPLIVPLAATAYPRPAIIGVSSAGGMTVRVNQPALVSWQVRRLNSAPWSARGGRFTTGSRRYVAHLGLHLARGTYRLTVTAVNAHGNSGPLVRVVY